MITDFLDANNIFFFEDDDAKEELPQHVIDGIKRGEEDAKAGRTITLDEFRKRFLLK
jgi:predicted transcriptional regulator